MPSKRRLIAIALLLFSPLVLRADAIDDYIGQRMQELRLPGVALAVLRNGAAVTIRTYGLANLELDVPVTEETVFELGSVTKQFTAAAIMMLVEQGKIGLDESIARYISGVPDEWRAITVRHLLTHSSGIQEYLSVPGLPPRAHSMTHQEMTRLFFETLKLEFRPGETWAYSNPGYLILGDIIERVSGKSYWAFLDERIFTPLGMCSTRSSEPDAIIQHRAAGYGWIGDRFVNRDALSENAYAAGSIASTIRDMARWEAALNEGKLLSRRSFEQIWTPLTVSRDGPPPFSYGFGWVVDQSPGGRVVLHSGGTPGFSSAVHRFVSERVTAIVLTNRGDWITDHVAMEVAGIAVPAVARSRAKSDPDPAHTERLQSALRDLMAGVADPSLFTPAMQLFLTTATGRGMWEWIGSHGEMKSFAYALSERADGMTIYRYQAVLGDAQLWFSVTVTDDGKIARVYWW